MSIETATTQQQSDSSDSSTSYNDSLLDMMPENYTLTTEEKQRVEQLREKIESSEFGLNKLSPTQTKSYKTTRLVFLTRHLISRDWVVDDALAMIKDAAEWRNSEKIDTHALFPNPIARIRGYDEAMESLIEIQGVGVRKNIGNSELDEAAKSLQGAFAACWHKYDKRGRPCYFERTGATNTTELLARCKALAPPGAEIGKVPGLLHVLSNETGAMLVHYCNKHKIASPPTTGVTAVLDLEGLSMELIFSEAMDLLKAQSASDKKYYAEGLARVLLINAPGIARFALAIVKPLLTARQQAKIHMYAPGEETKTALLSVIDEKCIPVEYGGTCKCGGEEGCIPKVEVEAPRGGTEEIVVKAGAVETREREVEEGGDVKFHVVVPEHDCILGVKFHPNNNNVEPIEVRAPAKTQGGVQETFSSPTTGKLVFSFDNSYSWLRSKTLAFRALVSSPTMKKEEEGKEEQSNETPSLNSASAASSQ